ncbi:ribokinase [Pseudarthrobacter sp. O4]|uniref:ribokinase n=1 Tax=Pseudarthrobacter sp. O4 TaxID=3418417 RepID=UPI003CED14F6
MKQERVGVIGSINVDLLLLVDRLPRPGQTVLGEGGTLSPGGKGANQAVAAARQGVPTLMVGAVGTDGNAGVSTSLLREANVDLCHVAALEGPTGMAVVAVDRAGENNIIVVPAANLRVDTAMVEAALPELMNCAVVIVQGEIPATTVDFAVHAIAGTDTRVILNLAPVIGVAAETLRLADPLIVNEHEAAEALSLLSAEIPAASGDAIRLGKSLAEALIDTGVPSAVVTLGSDGAIIAGAGGIEHLLAPTVDAVDTTGAGDAFVGTAAAGLARGLTLIQACTLAVRAAAESVQAHGAQTSYPWNTPHMTTLPH